MGPHVVIFSACRISLIIVLVEPLSFKRISSEHRFKAPLSIDQNSLISFHLAFHHLTIELHSSIKELRNIAMQRKPSLNGLYCVTLPTYELKAHL